MLEFVDVPYTALDFWRDLVRMNNTQAGQLLLSGYEIQVMLNRIALELCNPAVVRRPKVN